MKTLGLLGGMSWESSAVYYRCLNQLTRERLGGLHSCKILLNSLDFAEIEACQMAGDWKKDDIILLSAAQSLERAGADALVICTNTMHKLASMLEEGLTIPLIHIADATAAEIKKRGLRHPLLLGTRFTMEQDFYKGRLREMGIEVTVPADIGRTFVHDVIYNELCQGIVLPESKAGYLDIVKQSPDVDCVILGCTEIGLLISQNDLAIPVLDTAMIHVEAALEFALSEAQSAPETSASHAMAGVN